jgi:hypothetical protein
MKTPIDILMDSVDWEEIHGIKPTSNDDILYATHSGVLEIAGVSLRCYRLNNGINVIDEEDIHNLFGG